ncbi:predicted protein [Aspergillus terreus NIH2624]|uniref:Altered inheritance of mitochondria protein 9, mitochondrial n=1 Tax=Aspergillus terreus (strain NIH 2624 / FGSC A1156) TaxID=341663 RepID=Q0C847_ASPTN|nr:uncharacterized protein ATEG_10137 [Aspergillus terreus NIH2624]EAU29586.1 predicted protein [Aspergillus terreus NIH2624]
MQTCLVSALRLLGFLARNQRRENGRRLQQSLADDRAKWNGGCCQNPLSDDRSGEIQHRVRGCCLGTRHHIRSVVGLHLMCPVKSHTSVPVPKVLAWCCDASDPVGTEYILMEKAKGRPLVEVWGELDQLQKIRVIQNLAYLESQLALQRFPAYGGL